VYDILDMYRDLRFAYENLGSTSGVEEAAVSFRGFDGNNEPKALLYARFLIKDLGKWEELAPALEFGLNSHTPMLDSYRGMLEVWPAMPVRSGPARARTPCWEPTDGRRDQADCRRLTIGGPLAWLHAWLYMGPWACRVDRPNRGKPLICQRAGRGSRTLTRLPSAV
jgi:hypothetical protein